MADLIQTLYDDLAYPRIGKDCVVTTSTFIPLPNHVYYIPLIKEKSYFDGLQFLYKIKNKKDQYDRDGIGISSKNQLNFILKHPMDAKAEDLFSKKVTGWATENYNVESISLVNSSYTTAGKLLDYYQKIYKDLYYKFIIYVHAGSKGCGSNVNFDNIIWSIINGENGKPALTPGYLYRVECEWVPFIQSFIANKDSKNKVSDNSVEGYFTTRLADNSDNVLEQLRLLKGTTTPNLTNLNNATTAATTASTQEQTTTIQSNNKETDDAPAMNGSMGSNWYTPLTIKLTDDPKYYVSNAGHEAGAVIYGKVTEYARVIRIVSHIKSDIVETLYYRMSTDKSQTWKKIGKNALKQEPSTKEWYYDIQVQNPGDYVEFWNKNSTFSKSQNDFVRFNLRMHDARGVWECSGNVQSLLNYQQSTAPWCFYCLFAESSYMTTAPLVPSPNLTTGCYWGMFGNCWKLEEPPKLPATTMADSCYINMFYQCHFMSYCPDLPATNLSNAPRCYEGMFDGCSLISEAKLPANILSPRCYLGMFKNCGSLWHLAIPTKSDNGVLDPNNRFALPAGTCQESCYQSMFENCTSLTEFPYIGATTAAKMCCYSMFHNCSALQYQVRLYFNDISPVAYEGCLSYMFQGCKLLDQIGVKFKIWNQNNTTYWLDDTNPNIPTEGNKFFRTF